MGAWTLDDIPLGPLRPRRRSIPSCVRDGQGGEPCRAQRRRLRAPSLPVFADDPEFQAPPGAGARRRSSTARRWRAGRCLPTRPSISPPPSTGSATVSGSTSTLPTLAPRLAHRRAGGALHRRDRHQLVLHRARDAAAEPVLSEICRRIAGRRAAPLQALLRPHRPLPGAERLGRWGRVRIALGRIAESEDDELAYAYYAANEPGERTSAAAAAGPMRAAPLALPAAPRRARSRCC